MAFQSVPETAEITVNCAINGVSVQNTYHARKEGGYSEADLELMAAAFDLIAGDSATLGLYSNALTYAQVEVRGLESENDLVVQNSDSAGPGTRTNQELPAQVAFVIKRLSAFTGRSARGRIYWFGFANDMIQGNTNFMQMTFADQILAIVELYRAAILAQSWVPVIVSRFSGGVKRETGVTFVWINSAYTDLRLDTRRDRLP